MTQTMLMIHALGRNPHHRLSGCSVPDNSLLGLASLLLSSAGRVRGWTLAARSQGEGEMIPRAAVCLSCSVLIPSHRCFPSALPFLAGEAQPTGAGSLGEKRDWAAAVWLRAIRVDVSQTSGLL